MDGLPSRIMAAFGEVRCTFDFAAGNDQELSFARGDVLRLVEKTTPNWWKCAAGDRTGMVPAPYVEAIVVDEEEETVTPRASATRGSSSRKLSFGHEAAPATCAAEAADGGFALSIDGGRAAVKGGAELLAFEAAVRAVADDDGLAALAADDRLFEAGALEAAVGARDADAVGNWVDALLEAPALAPLARAFVSGEGVEASAVETEGARVEARVLYDFEPSSSSELALVAGEVVLVDVASVADRCAIGPARAVRAAAVDGWNTGRNPASGLAGYFPSAYVAAVAAGTDDAPSPPTPAKKRPDRASRVHSVRSCDAFDRLLNAGLAVEVDAPGDGRAAAPGDAVVARVTASAWDGGSSAATPFCSTDWEGETTLRVVLGVGAVASGLDAALTGLKRGARVKATVAPNRAYGAAGYPPDVAPNAFVVYDVELVDAAPAPAAPAAPRGPAPLLARSGGLPDAPNRGERLKFAGRSTRLVAASLATVAEHA